MCVRKRALGRAYIPVGQLGAEPYYKLGTHKRLPSSLPSGLSANFLEPLRVEFFIEVEFVCLFV